MNLETCELMTMDTIFRIASVTKPITSVLAMVLYEEKKFNLEDPITKWISQFRNMKVLKKQSGEYEDANRVITVLDLPTHRAGFTYSGFQKGKLKEDYDRILGGDIDTECTNEQWINWLACLPLVSQPGELFNYGKSTDLLGMIISVIEEKKLGKVMEEKIFNPLGMTDTFFYVPNNKKSRCASDMGYGLWSTIGDYLKIAKLFVENGSSDGIPILKPETIHFMCSNQLTDYQREHSILLGSTMFRDHYGFGLGLAVVVKESKYGSMPCAGSVGSVGWPGAYGGCWSADPVKKAISIFLTHSMTELKQLAQGIGFELFEAIDIFSNYSREKIYPII